ncbi:MAG: hypothetical protein ACTSRS_04930 [Candidatus Helarchaeota archaeon]
MVLRMNYILGKKQRSLIWLLIYLLIFVFLTISRPPFRMSIELISADNDSIESKIEFEPSIGIFYDSRFSEPWNFGAGQLTIELNQTLRAYNLKVKILNATELKLFMENNLNGIIIITMGIVPSNIWNGTETSFIETWLDGGGIIIWTGCEEFYWIGMDTGENIPVGHKGSQYVLDMNYLKTLSDQSVTPTINGNVFIPNITAHTSDVFSSISALEASKVYFEAYATSGDYADPILFQPRGGSGYFVRIHADWNNQLSISTLADWISSYIYSRFFKSPIITHIQTPDSIYLLDTAKISINVTNYSNESFLLQIISNADVIQPINESIYLVPFEKIKFDGVLRLQSAARYQNSEISITLLINFTDLQNHSQVITIYQKIFELLIRPPLAIYNVELKGSVYPGSANIITFALETYLNETLPLTIILICEGCINEIKLPFFLVQNNSIYEVPIQINLMATSGEYFIQLHVFYGIIPLLSTNLKMTVQSIMSNPYFIGGLVTSIIIIITFMLYSLRKRKRSKQAPSVAVLKSIKTDKMQIIDVRGI